MASEIVAVAEKEETQLKFEEALEKIKTLETGISTNCDMLLHHQVDNLAIAQTLMSSRTEAATSTMTNSFDGFNSDLTQQLDAARSLHDALHQQMRDEQERADALQKQLVRAKEQASFFAPTLARVSPPVSLDFVSSSCFTE